MWTNTDYELAEIACSLIANGVTVGDANNATTTWISVEDRLPTEEGRYLCVTKDYYTKPIVYICNFANDLSRTYITEEKISGWYECAEWGDIYVDDVTHWMPLPQPPKEVE